MMNEKAVDMICQKFDRVNQVHPENYLYPKNMYRSQLVRLRFGIRSMMEILNTNRQLLWSSKHQMAKLKENAISFPLGEAYVQMLMQSIRELRDCLAEYGELTVLMLDRWQEAGATLEELANLCNAPSSRLRKAVEYYKDEPVQFSALMTVCNLDYPDNGDDFLEESTDAPFTHACKERLLNWINSTDEGKQAADQAMEEVFPYLLENALYTATDCEGRKVLVDKGGETVAYLDKEE